MVNIYPTWSTIYHAYHFKYLIYLLNISNLPFFTLYGLYIGEVYINLREIIVLKKAKIGYMQKNLYNIIYAFSYFAMHVIKMNLFELPK